MDTAQELFDLAQAVANETPGFFDIQGPGPGDRLVNHYIMQLNERVGEALAHVTAQAAVCGECGLTVDFYSPNDGLIVEVALGLKYPNSEFEKDILKAILAREYDKRIVTLMLIGRPGGEKACAAPGRHSMIAWAGRNGLDVIVRDLQAALV